MTRREKFLKALRNEKVDGLVWAPNIDYWLGVNRAEGTLPRKYWGLSRYDIIRRIGASIWGRASSIKTIRDRSVVERKIQYRDERIREYETPVGTIREVYRRGEGRHRSMFRVEHFIKDAECIRTMRYVVEATHYEPDYEPSIKALKEIGDDGIVVNQCFCVPFVQFAKSDAGYVNAFYLWMDYRKEVDMLIEAYTRLFLQGYKILADGPADVISTGDNMDGVMISPALFQEYAIPFYQEAKRILSARGKIFEGHWCGRTENLLGLASECGLDVLEAVVTYPMANISLAEALDILDGKVVLQGGIPSVLVCNEGGTRDDFGRYIEEVVLPQAGRRGFVLGMSDNVPPNADFARVEAVAELIACTERPPEIVSVDIMPCEKAVRLTEVNGSAVLVEENASEPVQPEVVAEINEE